MLILFKKHINSRRSDGSQLALALGPQRLQLLLPLLPEIAREVHLAAVVLGQPVRVAEREAAVPAGRAQHARPSLAAETTAFWLLDRRGELFVGALQRSRKGLALGQLAIGDGGAVGVSLGNREWTLF